MVSVDLIFVPLIEMEKELRSVERQRGILAAGVDFYSQLAVNNFTCPY